MIATKLLKNHSGGCLRPGNPTRTEFFEGTMPHRIPPFVGDQLRLTAPSQPLEGSRCQPMPRLDPQEYP